MSNDQDTLGLVLKAQGSHGKQLKLDKDNDFFTKGELTPQMKKLLEGIAGRGMTEVMKYCFFHDFKDGRHSDPAPLDERWLQIAMRRFVAVTWLMHSEFLLGVDGEPLSLRALGKLPQLSCTRCALSLLAQRFGKFWNFRARVQKRASTKPTYAASAKTGWKKRREREAAAATASAANA